MAKTTRRPARRKIRDPADLPKKFGGLVNADYIVAQSRDAMGLTGECDALTVVDRATDYKECYPLLSRTSADAEGALLDFFG